MLKNFFGLKLIFAEKFVSQDFTISAAPWLSGPTNTCGDWSVIFVLNTTFKYLYTQRIIALKNAQKKQEY